MGEEKEEAFGVWRRFDKQKQKQKYKHKKVVFLFLLSSCNIHDGVVGNIIFIRRVVRGRRRRIVGL